jgi:predicted HTH transcriptional regulator
MTTFNTEELLKQISLGEDSRIELKNLEYSKNAIIRPHRNSMADEMAAMANAHGGMIILGADDKSHLVAGLPPEKMDLSETWPRNIANDLISPPLECSIRKLYVQSGINEKAIIKIDIPRSIFVHKSPGGYFYRIGSSKREMQPEVLARLFQQRTQNRFIRFDEQILMSCESPERFISNAFIQAVCYLGNSRDSKQLDAQDISGPLDTQIKEACKFVQRNMRISAIKNPGRIETPQYSLNAVFEAVVNAVAHRDYSIYGSKIRLHMFSDRLELYSPGSIPNTMTIESLSLRQSSRNELLSSLLARCRMNFDATGSKRLYIMDKHGEGVPIILSESMELSGKKPEYALIDDTELKLTIFASSVLL